MKKKNLITTVASVALVGVIAVGSTLAYLSAQDGTLTNTFTFANDIVVDVYETTNESSYASVTSDGGKGVGVNGGIDYSNLIPGQTLNKNVDLDVDTTFETYLYVNIKADGDGKKMTLGALEGWTPVEGKVDDNGYGIYRKDSNVSAKTDAIDVFDTVTVPDVDSTENVTINPITINVWAAQASAFENSAAADAAAGAYFNPAP